MKKIIFRVFIVIIILVCFLIIIHFVGNKQIVDYEISNISIVCLDTNKEIELKKDEVVDFIPHLVDIYKIKDRNFNKWDVSQKVKIIINKKNTIKITDYAGSNYYGYYNDDNIVMPGDVYKNARKYCEEDVDDGKKQNNG